jgi:hypothetical protein
VREMVAEAEGVLERIGRLAVKANVRR